MSHGGSHEERRNTRYDEITLDLSFEAPSSELLSTSTKHTGANKVFMKLANSRVLSFDTTRQGGARCAHSVEAVVTLPAARAWNPTHIAFVFT